MKKRRTDLNLDENQIKFAKAKKIIILMMSISLLIFLVIAFVAVLNEGLSKFVLSILSINPFYFLISILVIFLGYVMRYPKWELYLKRLGIRIKRNTNFMIYLSMYSMDMTPGRWGRGVVAYTVNRITKTKFGKVLPAVIADNFTDFLGFAVLSLIMAFLVNKYLDVSLFITFLLLIPFLFLFNKKPFEFVKSRFGHIRFLRGFFKEGLLYFKNVHYLGLDVYLYSMIYTIPSMFMNGLALYFVILSTGITLGISAIPVVVFIYTSSLLIGVITGIPGALGVTDTALISYLLVFFSSSGIDFGMASLITILFRIVSLWFVEGFGFASLIYTLKYW
ncbi:MAG: lysylphosphatidylglycerol synthase transmembrane domain-containing protein [Candidatus Micrarchaeia archaeon]